MHPYVTDKHLILHHYSPLMTSFAPPNVGLQGFAPGYTRTLVRLILGDTVRPGLHFLFIPKCQVLPHQTRTKPFIHGAAFVHRGAAFVWEPDGANKNT